MSRGGEIMLGVRVKRRSDRHAGGCGERQRRSEFVGRDRGSRRAACRDSIIVAEDRLGVTDGEERVVGERE